MFNTSELLPLTDQQNNTYNSLVAHAKGAIKPQSDKVRQIYIETRIANAVAHGIDENIAKKDVSDSLNLGTLNGSHLLYFAHESNPVTVEHVLRNIDQYDGKSLADPMEPDYNGGSQTAIFYANMDTGKPIVYTQAHGGRAYCVKQQSSIPTAFGLIPSTDLTNKQIYINWLVKDVMESDSYGQLFGEPASGKSLIILEMGFCISTGIEWYGHKTTLGSVIYIAGEGFNGLQRRLKSLEIKYGRKAPNLYLSQAPAAFTEPESAKSVADAIETVCPTASVVIIDTLHRNFGGGDENSSKDFGLFTSNIDKYIRKDGKTVVLVHHSGHGNSNRGRGSSAIKASMDFEYMVSKTNDVISMQCTKAKDMEPPQILSFKVVSQPIDEWVDEDGRSLGSVILESTYTPIKVKSLTPRESVILNALVETLNDNGIKPERGIKDAFPELGDSIEVIHLDSWRQAAYSVMEGEKKASMNTVFNRARKKLEALNKVQNHDGYYWLVSESLFPKLK